MVVLTVIPGLFFNELIFDCDCLYIMNTTNSPYNNEYKLSSNVNYVNYSSIVV